MERFSGVTFQNGFNDIPVDTFFSDSLFAQAQALIESLAIATGNASSDVLGGWLTGSFCIVIERDHDGNGLVGLLPAAPINTATKNQPTDL